MNWRPKAPSLCAVSRGSFCFRVTMPAVAKLTMPFCTKHPHVTVDVKSMTSVQIQVGLDKFELDAGLTYLENEPLSNVRQKRLYRERYLFVTHVDSPLAQTGEVTWRAAAHENLCLLHESMQNRRVLNKLTESLGVKLKPTVTSDGGFWREVQHLRALGLTKENRVGSKRWGVALRVGIQGLLPGSVLPREQW